MKRFLRSDQVFGLIWMTLGSGFCIGSLKLNLGGFHNPGPGFMPFVLGAALALLGLVLMLLAVINELGRKQGGKAKQLFERDNLKRLFTVAATLLAYIMIFEYIGFLLSSFLFFFSLFKYITPKSWLGPLVLSGSAVILSYLVFCVWLRSELPRGIFNLG